MKKLFLLIVFLLAVLQGIQAKPLTTELTVLNERTFEKYSIPTKDAVVVVHQPKVFFSFIIKWVVTNVKPQLFSWLKQQVFNFAKSHRINLLSQAGNGADTETITIQIENQDGHYITDTYCQDHDGDNVGDHYEHYEDDTEEGLGNHVLESFEHQVTWLETNYGH